MNNMSILAKTFQAGKLFAWEAKQTPKLMQLPENIYKASVGVDHIVAIGQSGNLYSFGSGSDGKLGHSDTKDQKQPKLVEYFSKNNIKIKDVVAGERHTIALTEDGEVYTWGFGRKNINFLMKIFMNPSGPTGHGVDIPATISKPRRVKSLEGYKIERITAGRNFCIVYNDKNQVLNWGNGEYAAFGDGKNENYDVPVRNEFFDYLFEEQKMKIKKVKSCESYSVGLMDNGKLYGWGSNEHGQMGIKSQIGLQMYETVNFATEVIRQGYEEHKVKNFDISDTTLMFQLQNDELWWTGMKIAYKPERVKLDVKPKLFAAGQRSIVIVDEDNYIYSKNDFLESKQQPTLEEVTTGYAKIQGKKFFGDGDIVGIGGQYAKRYAIVL